MFTVVASATTRSVCDSGCDYTSIGAAETASSPYDTIIVHDGTYTGNVDVDVAHLTIRSQNGADSTTVQAHNANDHVFYVNNADYVNISGFTVTGTTGAGKAGIHLYRNADHCNISDNNVSNNRMGIYLYESSNNELTNNIANSNYYASEGYGIYLCYSSNNSLTNNTANSNTWCGINLCDADDNNITCNWVAHNEQRGFFLHDGSTGNNISYNNIMSNGEYNATSGGWEWNFYNNQSDAVVAEHNYWGTTSSAVIAAGIKADTGSVDYEPFLTEPDPCAPIPEAATIILFSIGLVVLAGYVVLRRSRK